MATNPTETGDEFHPDDRPADTTGSTDIGPTLDEDTRTVVDGPGADPKKYEPL